MRVMDTVTCLIIRDFPLEDHLIKITSSRGPIVNESNEIVIILSIADEMLTRVIRQQILTLYIRIYHTWERLIRSIVHKTVTD